MVRNSLVTAVLWTCLAASTTPSTAGSAPALRFSAKDIEPGSIMSPAGDYAAALGDAAKFPPERRLTVRGTVVGKDGKPVPGLLVFLFPLDEKGPSGVLGVVDGKLVFANPRATTDSAGRFSIAAGPLWEFDERAVLGLLVHRAPDRPFDVGVRVVEDAQGTKQVSLDTKQRQIDVGAITLTAPEAE
jgi:hypothetical protein